MIRPHLLFCMFILIGASSISQYIHSPVGVFPAPLGPSTKFTVVENVCSKFKLLGKLMARAILDSRMVSHDTLCYSLTQFTAHCSKVTHFTHVHCLSIQLDIGLSEAFYKWMLGLEHTFTAQDLQHVDPVMARSFAQLAAVALKKHTLESDPLLVSPQQ